MMVSLHSLDLAGLMRRGLPRPADAFLAALGATVLCGLAVARMTLDLNQHFYEDISDTFLLHVYFVVGYGFVGAVLGTLGAVLVGMIHRLVRAPRVAWLLAVGIVAGLALGPLAYALLLPGGVFASSYLTHLLALRGARLVGEVLLVAAFLVILGWALALALGVLARRRGDTVVRPLAVAVFVLAAVVVVLGTVRTRPPVETTATVASEPVVLPPAPAEPPPRVVLLMIDGADLDDVIEPMVAAGDLPTFAGLMREGAWGELETLEPTLSAVVWTTVITGKVPAEHGIHHFLHFRFPGIERAIYEFPLHTGLNFHVFPLLERVPGLPRMRAPYTGNMRRAEALWNIAGRRYPVGAYRWLITWPAEELNGFSVAGGLGFVQFDAGTGGTKRGTVSHPPALVRELEKRRPREVATERLATFVGAGHEIDRDAALLKPFINTLADPAVRDLPRLIDRFGVRFLAANFYPVDVFHHLHNPYRDRGGIYSDAIAEVYRHTDARLGEMLEALGDDTHVIVISDHGFDFVENHHTYAPVGVFFARGPAFKKGRIDKLSVYDIAPLVLHLLDMPLPEDMPGTFSGAYRAALDPAFLESRPEERIATYEEGREVSHESIESPKDEELRKLMDSLGYVDN